MDKHLIFMDIDGTLVNNQQEISKKTKTVINMLQKKGIYFMLQLEGNTHLPFK